MAGSVCRTRLAGSYRPFIWRPLAGSSHERESRVRRGPCEPRARSSEGAGDRGGSHHTRPAARRRGAAGRTIDRHGGRRTPGRPAALVRGGRREAGGPPRGTGAPGQLGGGTAGTGRRRRRAARARCRAPTRGGAGRPGSGRLRCLEACRRDRRRPRPGASRRRAVAGRPHRRRGRGSRPPRAHRRRDRRPGRGRSLHAGLCARRHLGA